MLSNGKITIQWIAIYLNNSVIQPVNNWGLVKLAIQAWDVQMLVNGDPRLNDKSRYGLFVCLLVCMFELVFDCLLINHVPRDYQISEEKPWKRDCLLVYLF